MNYKVLSVAALPGYRLELEFSNRERRLFDMRPYLQYPVFRPLENLGFFALARVDYGTVVWPGEIDIAPETLYELSVPQENSRAA